MSLLNCGNSEPYRVDLVVIRMFLESLPPRELAKILLELARILAA